MFERYRVVSENDYDAEPRPDQKGVKIWPQMKTEVYETHNLFLFLFIVPFFGGPILALFPTIFVAWFQEWRWNSFATATTYGSLVAAIEIFAIWIFTRSFNSPPDIVYAYKFLGMTRYFYQARIVVLPGASAVPLPFGQEMVSSGMKGDQEAISTSLMLIGDEGVQLAPLLPLSQQPEVEHLTRDEKGKLVLESPSAALPLPVQHDNRLKATKVQLKLKVVLRVNSNNQPIRTTFSYYKEFAQAVDEYISRPWRMSRRRNHLDQALNLVKAKAMQIILSALDRELQKHTAQEMTTNLEQIAMAVETNIREMLAEIAIRVIVFNIEEYDDAEGADFFAQVRRRTNAILTSNADIIAADASRASRVRRADQGRIAAEAEQQSRAAIAIAQADAVQKELLVARITAEVGVQPIKAKLALFEGPEALKMTLLQAINGMSPAEQSAMVVSVFQSLRNQIAGGSIVSLGGNLEQAIAPKAVVDALQAFVENVLPGMRGQTSAPPVPPTGP